MGCIVHGVTKSPTRLSDFHYTSSPIVLLTCRKEFLIYSGYEFICVFIYMFTCMKQIYFSYSFLKSLSEKLL